MHSRQAMRSPSLRRSSRVVAVSMCSSRSHAVHSTPAAKPACVALSNWLVAAGVDCILAWHLKAIEIGIRHIGSFLSRC